MTFGSFFFSFSLSQSRSSLLMSSTSLIVFFRSFSECPRFKMNLESILQFCIYSVVSEQMRLMRMNPFGKFLVTDDVSDDLMIHLSASYNRSHLPEWMKRSITSVSTCAKLSKSAEHRDQQINVSWLNYPTSNASNVFFLDKNVRLDVYKSFHPLH